MKDYEYSFCLSLHDKIRDVIKPSVYVMVDDRDRLCVIIHDKHYGITYDWTLEGFTKRFNNGVTTKEISRDVINAYRSYINQKFFK